MNPGFQGHFRGRTADGENWTLDEPLEYHRPNGERLRGIPGATTDGPSIPAALQGLVSPIGPLWLCGALHDWAYRAYLERWDLAAGAWVPWVPTKAESDDLISEAMHLAGIHAAHRFEVYQAVHLFGHPAFIEDRKAAEAAGRIK